MEKPKVRLEKWYIAGNRLMGSAYGHPRFPDGESVITSSLKDGVPETNYKKGDVVETRNTLYELGEEA